LIVCLLICFIVIETKDKEKIKNFEFENMILFE